MTDLSPAKAELLARWREAAEETETTGDIPARTSHGPAPLSLAQQRLWILEQLQPGSAAYNLFFCGRLSGRLDPDALTAAVADLVRRHETLRTAVVTIGGRPAQRTDALPPELAVVDLRDSADFDAAVRENMDEAIHLPFALRTGPPARFLLLRGPHRDCLGLVVHHLIGDGWSLGVALRDLSACYQARVRDKEPELDAMPVTFADFASWQREAVRAEDWQADLGYWSDRLRDLTPLELPLDRPRPAILSLDGDWLPIQLGTRTSDGIRALARARDTTAFTVLLALYTTLLSRLGGQTDLTVGTAVAHRGHPQTYGLIGNFINMLALRTDVAGDPTFGELVSRVHRTCAAAYAHQEVPFERVVEEINPPRDTSRGAIFQTTLVMQPASAPADFAGLDLELIELGSRTVRADLELHLWDRPEFVGRLAFSTDLFDRTTAQAFVDRFVQLAENAVAEPGRRLTELPMLLADERMRLQQWSRGAPAAASFVPVHDQIAEQARLRPDAPAVVDSQGHTLTFAELQTAATGLARRLVSLGVRPETRVGICLERSVDLAVAALGVLASGGAYVPLDPGYPAERLNYLAEDSAAPIVITSPELAETKLAGLPAKLVWIDGDDVPADRPSTVDSESLAYVIYTSGSTGRPKGVQIEHRSLANLAYAMRRRPGLGPDDTMTMIASLSFDASVAELFPPLAAGARVVVVDADDARDGRRLAALIERHKVTVVQAVATTWRLLQGAGGVDSDRVRALCGGEPIGDELASSLADRYEAWNMYGPTESTVWSSCGPLTADGPVLLGEPMDGVRLHVLDDSLEPVPVGVYGELCIAGAHLARGYLDRPDLTAQRFVPDPYGPAGSRLYRTGDRARRRQDGSLEFAGRADDQVKLRGYRIELGEIEAELAAHELVAEAAVAVQPPGRLVGHVVLAADTSATPAEITGQLRNALRLRLPDYMVPAAFTFLPKLPTTANGKLDRRALPEPGRDRSGSAPYVVPGTDLEKEVAGFAADSLGVRRVGLYDDFFDLGGHSLTAAQLVAALSVRFGVDLSVQDLFVNPTVSHLAALVRAELDRSLHLTDEDGRIRRLVAEMSEETVDMLTTHLLRAGDGAART